MLTRRRFLQGLVTLPFSSPCWRFICMPDFLNNDTLYPQPGWEDTLTAILDSIKAENPDFLLIPGDLVQGRWHGEAEINAYADVYYPAWKARLEAVGLPYYVCIGDHEIGDWLPVPPPNEFDLFKAKFKQYLPMPWNGPECAYSFEHKGILFVALDVFRPDGDIYLTVEQFNWLDALLANHAGRAIVFGHVPILGPVPWENSSRLMFKGGRASPLWQLLNRYGVKLYLCGEVHAPSYLADGVPQVVSGSLIGYNAAANYLVVSVFDDSLELEIKQVNLSYSGGYLPQVGGINAPREIVNLDGGFYSIGRLGPQEASGVFAAAGCEGRCVPERVYRYWFPAMWG